MHDAEIAQDDTEEYVIPLFRYTEGVRPLIINVPHCGAYLPPEIEADMTDAGKAVMDTDWHVDQLFEFAAGQEGMGAHMLAATHARYVIDLNRDPGGADLYPGQYNSGLCPLESFSRESLYLQGKAPTAADIRQRIATYWHPYHARLQQLIQQVRRQHGMAILLDAHSVRSRVPVLFDGELPAVNIGSFDGKTLPDELQQQVVALCEKGRFSYSVNDRFKGGYITRHYAKPEERIFSIQLEIVQAHYMEEELPLRYMELRAAKLQKLLGDITHCLIDYAMTRG